jgi:K+-sensing histidine kinase KdpD
MKRLTCVNVRETVPDSFLARADRSSTSTSPSRTSETVNRISTRDFVELLDNINLAGDLGAETVWLKSDDIVAALLEFAREHGITKIVIGRTHQPLWRRLLKGDVTKRLLSAANDFDVEVVGGDNADEADKES